MTLSKQQLDDLKPWQKYVTLWERDLLHLAGQYEGWLDIAVDLGFSVEKILRPWTFPDAGRQVKVMTWDDFRAILKKMVAEEQAKKDANFDAWAREFAKKWDLPFNGILLLAGKAPVQ